jgi:ubiquinone/menaquinone biosynthesis C-methylase UbiE
MVQFWRRYLDGIPEYLARHYWWAYLSPRGVWFFDHHFIINLILYGQYATILDEVMRRYGEADSPRTLQLTCAYGALTPTLAASAATGELHLMDAAEIQLHAAQRKIPFPGKPVLYARIDAESLAYASDSFDTVVIFFLLHELPADARQRALNEALRVLKPGGRLLIAEYGANEGKHLLHRLPPARWLTELLEPFLRDFWHADLHALLMEAIRHNTKSLALRNETPIFGGFYRVAEYRLN